VLDRIERDVDDVLIGDGVRHLAAPASAGQHPGLLEDLEVLGHERLGGVEGLDEVVDAAFSVADLEHDGQTEGMAEGSQELGGGLEV